MALSTGNGLTLTASGTQRLNKLKEHTYKIAYASSGYPTSGLPLPTTASSWGLKSRFDEVVIIDSDEDQSTVVKLDKETNRLHVYTSVLASGTGQTLQEISSGSTVTAFEMYGIARGY